MKRSEKKRRNVKKCEKKVELANRDASYDATVVRAKELALGAIGRFCDEILLIEMKYH